MDLPKWIYQNGFAEMDLPKWICWTVKSISWIIESECERRKQEWWIKIWSSLIWDYYWLTTNTCWNNSACKKDSLRQIKYYMEMQKVKNWKFVHESYLWIDLYLWMDLCSRKSRDIHNLTQTKFVLVYSLLIN